MSGPDSRIVPEPWEGDPPVSEETGLAEGLTAEEYTRIVELLGRTPTMAELGVFAVQWSEHCSYKSSRIHLKKFPTESDRVLLGPGENSGVIDLGDGWASAFKVESHNHPSYVEPYQGAATGVGGILRDIFTMGARPIASLDSLRFGSLAHPRTRYLVDGVIRGVGDYGNCFGCPTVGGEVTFHPSYDGNCLVNAMNLGVMRRENIFQAIASGVGNPVLYFGSRTGRDGIHGAGLLASAEFAEGDEDKRPTVQVGDPFTEKCLLEATLEIMERGLVVGIQDMGAAGLTCSSLEMAGRAGNGIRLDLDLVPLREERMTPYEILLSESQERMLLVTPKGKEAEALEVFERWGLQGAVVGEVTDDGHLSISMKGRLVARLPVPPLSDELPAYDRPYERPPWQDEVQRLDLDQVAQPKDLGATLEDLIASPALCSRHWVWHQYDHMVRTNTVAGPGGDAAVVRVEGAGRKAVSISIDCNPRFCFLDPRRGGALAVLESARNVACTGAEPVAITNCLNFGNPEKPPIMWQFVEAVEGMAEACRALNTPVTGGNVSFYNETSGNAVHPTPAVGMVGLLEDAGKAVGSSFVAEGDEIVLLGETREDLGGSEYLAHVHGIEAGRTPEPDFEGEAALCRFLVEGAREGLLRSAHDCAEGGLAVTALESCFRPEHAGPPLGCEIDLGPEEEIRDDALLFGETPGRVLASCLPEDADRLIDMAARHGVPAVRCGSVCSGRLTLRREGEVLVDRDTAPLYRAWREAFDRLAEGD